MRRMLPQLAGTYKVCALVAVCCSTFSVTHAETTTDAQSASFTFRDGGVHHRKVLDRDGLLIAESDMILGKSSARRGKQVQGLSNSRYGRLWPNGVVPYHLNASLNEATRQKIQEAVAHWNSIDAITLVERTSSNASAYPHYIDFVYENRCASWIGFQETGPQAIYTGDRCSTGTMIHEIGHALGLLHEHTRPDRDQYVDILWDEISPGMEVNFEILEGSVQLGDYDYGSIMHYGEYFFSRAGRPTMEPLMATSQQIGQRVETSQGDREAVAQLYQTDLTLVATADEEVALGDDIELELLVTNNTDTGANSLTINIPLSNELSLKSYQSSSWSCFEHDDGAVCEAHVLAPGATTRVALSLAGQPTARNQLFDATLSSRTRDTYTADNHDIASTRIADVSSDQLINETTPVIASALDGGSETVDVGGRSVEAGGGSVDVRLLAVLLALFASMRRRLRPV